MHGTEVRYLPDSEIFGTVMTDREHFRRFFNDICCLCQGLTVVFNGEEIKQDGLGAMLDSNLDGECIQGKKLVFTASEGNQKMSLGLAYQDASSSKVLAYMNCGLTETGPHIAAMKATITRTMNSWAKENGVLKDKDKPLDGPSVQEGLVLVCNVDTPTVAYQAQDKKNVVRCDTKFISTALSDALEKFLDNNPAWGKEVLEKALLARKAAEAARKAREAVKKGKQQTSAKRMPSKLVDAWSKDRSKCELLICEGLSAASSLVEGRNGEFQAVYGVRGKCLSVLKATPQKILANQEISDLIQALGLECDTKTAKLKYDESKLRYGKIIACADAE
jgi:DNA gyrase subunit B